MLSESGAAPVGVAADAYADVVRIIGTRSGPVATSLMAIGLLCASGLEARTLVRALPDLIRTILPAQTIGFFWCDQHGRMTDAFVEEPILLSARVRRARQEFMAQHRGAWPTFRENMLAGPVCGHLLPFQTDRFYASSWYDLGFRPIGAQRMLDAVVHDGAAPLGCLLFLRSDGEGPFVASDLELARAIADLVALAWGADGGRAAAPRLYYAGLAVADQRGRLRYVNRAAHQSLWMLAHGLDAGLDGADDDGPEALFRQVCSPHLAAARAAGDLEQSMVSAWGAFRVRYEPAADGAVAVTFGHERPLDCHLASSMVALGLPPRRLAVCWLAVLGLPRKVIAARTGLSIDTVGEHMERLFADLGVASVVELAGRFSR